MIINKPYVLASIVKTTPDVTTFVFKAQDNTSVDFTPGMFAMLYYKNEETKETIGRAFSIANAPPSDNLEFFIALIHGKLTTKLEVAKVGDIYYVSAPYGQFKFDINAGSKFLFLAGGTGLAPFFSMLRYIKEKQAKADVAVLYSIKYPTEVIEREELFSYEQSLGAKVTITVTRPQDGDGWNGEKGHVDANMIKKYVPDYKDRVSYLCGPPNFVKALKEALVSLGVDERSIRAEMWGE